MNENCKLLNENSESQLCQMKPANSQPPVQYHLLNRESQNEF